MPALGAHSAAEVADACDYTLAIALQHARPSRHSHGGAGGAGGGGAAHAPDSNEDDFGDDEAGEAEASAVVSKQ